jgi:hypothetical protein
MVQEIRGRFEPMAGIGTPKYHNDMGDATEVVCAYCSTLYRFDPGLDPAAASPAEAVYIEV